MIQLQFLNYLLNTKDISVLTNNSINKDFFSDYEGHFDFIKSHIDTYGTIPDSETFISKFPDFDFIEVNETPQYLLDALYEDKNKRSLASVFNKIRNLLNSDKTEEAMKLFVTSTENLVAASHIQSVDLINDTSRYNDYVEKCSGFNKYYLTTGFKEIDDVLGGWDRLEELATIVARPGVGKCLEKGTEVWMADGSIKKVEDVVVGDKVQGNNCTNIVLALHHGTSGGYKITPEQGSSFVVSEQHTLTLYNKKSAKNHLVDMTIEDYLSLSKFQRSKYLLYKPSLDFKEKELEVSPYNFGVGINNLIHASPICNSIPLCYIKSSKVQRLELLAGIIDTSANLHNKMLRLSISSSTIIKQVRQICSSVGLITSEISFDANSSMYNISICGDLSIVPSKRFNLGQYKNKKYSTPSGTTLKFTVDQVDKVEYFGFRCTGDERYLLADGTITHNTWVLLKCAAAAAQVGLRVGIYSGEMSANKVGYRFDTLQGHVSNTGITRGRIEVQNDYKRYIDSLSENIKGNILVLTPSGISGAGKPAGISDLRAFIEQEKLDALFIDQHSLLEDDRRGRDAVTRASNISRDLKNLQVLKKIPIIAVSQQNRGKQEDEDAILDVSRIAQADRIGQDSTTVLFLEQKDNILTITIAKARDGGTGKRLKYAIDLDKGIFNYLPTEGDATGGQGCEELRNEYDPEIYAEESPF